MYSYLVNNYFIVNVWGIRKYSEACYADRRTKVSHFHFIRYAKQNTVLGWNLYNKFFYTLTNPWHQMSLYGVRLVKSKQKLLYLIKTYLFWFYKAKILSYLASYRPVEFLQEPRCNWMWILSFVNPLFLYANIPHFTNSMYVILLLT